MERFTDCWLGLTMLILAIAGCVKLAEIVAHCCSDILTLLSGRF